MLATGGIVVLFLEPSIARALTRSLGAFADPERFLSNDGILWNAVAADLREVVLSLAVPLALLVLAAVAGTLVQIGFVFASDKIGFDLSRISPAAGMGRLFSLRGLFETLKSLAKMVVVAVVAGTMLRSEIRRVPLAGSGARGHAGRDRAPGAAAASSASSWC